MSALDIKSKMAVVASFIGTWDLKALTMSGFDKGSNGGFYAYSVLALGWAALVSNLLLWTGSFYEFLINSLNPKRHYMDTWKHSMPKQRGLRVFAIMLAGSFGIWLPVTFGHPDNKLSGPPPE